MNTQQCPRHSRVLYTTLSSIITIAIILLPDKTCAAPATENEMNLYTRIAAVNLCLARAAGINFDVAARAAGETIAQLIKSEHASLIQQLSSNPLSIGELRKGSINSAVLGAYEICRGEIPEGTARKVEAALTKNKK